MTSSKTGRLPEPGPAEAEIMRLCDDIDARCEIMSHGGDTLPGLWEDMLAA